MNCLQMAQGNPVINRFGVSWGFFNELDLYPMGETCLAPFPCPYSLPRDNILAVLMFPLPLFLGII